MIHLRNIVMTSFMKQLVFILFLSVGFLKQVTGQTVVETANKSHKKFDEECVYKQKYSAVQRSKFYPFNIAGTIKLVSFRYHKRNYPVNGDTVLYDSLIEVKILTKNELNGLTDILYNNFKYKLPKPLYYKGIKYYIGEYNQCFFPRNAILFIDKKGRLRESVLICFHCKNHESSSDKIKLGEDCTGKIERLRQFYIAMKVVFGTDLNINEYLGEESDCCGAH